MEGQRFFGNQRGVTLIERETFEASLQLGGKLLERLGPYRGLVYFLGLAWSRGLLSGG